MIQMNNIELRNLEEQVLRNTQLLNMLPNGITGTNFRGIFLTIQEAGRINNNELALVGSSAPYTLYYKQDNNLVSLGKFPSTGPQGIQGVEGKQGPKGEDGTEIQTGGTAPTIAAENGTIYIDYITGNLYVYENKWVLKSNIRGPQGLTGNRGLQGPQGIQGIQGPQGEQGAPGASYQIQGQVNSVDELPSASSYSAYLVGQNLYISIGGQWVDTGAIFTDTVSVVNTTGNSETAAASQKLTTELTQLVNPANILQNAGFKDGTTGWSIETATVNEINLPANTVELYDSARKIQIGQIFSASRLGLPTGEYYASVKWVDNPGTLKISAYDASSNVTVVYEGEGPAVFDWNVTTYPRLRFQVFSKTAGVRTTFTEPLLVHETRPKTYYIPKYQGVFDAVNKVDTQELQIERIEEELIQKDFTNINNLIRDAGFNLGPGKNTYGWNQAWSESNEIIGTGLPANALKLTNSGSFVEVRQLGANSVFGIETGRYYASMKWLEGNKGYLRIGAYPVGSNDIAYLLRVNYDTPDEERYFDYDTSVYDRFQVQIGLGDVTSVTITEPILLAADLPHRYYNKPYEATFSAVQEVAKLKETDITSPLYGKVLTSNGDSIAAGAGGTSYVTQIGEANNMTYQNVAVGGGTIVPLSGHYSILSGISSMRSDADYVLIEGGVNDTYFLADGTITLGEVGTDYKTNYDTTTYCNCFQKMLYEIYTKYPTKTIMYISPHNHSNWKPGNAIYDASIAMCEKWGIPVCNLTLNTAPLARLNFLRSYTSNSDGQHPTTEGYKLFYTPLITHQLEQLSK